MQSDNIEAGARVYLGVSFADARSRAALLDTIRASVKSKYHGVPHPNRLVRLKEWLELVIRRISLKTKNDETEMIMDDDSFDGSPLGNSLAVDIVSKHVPMEDEAVASDLSDAELGDDNDYAVVIHTGHLFLEMVNTEGVWVHAVGLSWLSRRMTRAMAAFERLNRELRIEGTQLEMRPKLIVVASTYDA